MLVTTALRIGTRSNALLAFWMGSLFLTASSQSAALQADERVIPLPEVVRPISGSLVIAGGGGLPPEISHRFLELGGGEKAKLVVVTTASIFAGTEEMDARMGSWREQKLASLDVLHTRSREEANDPDFYRPLENATAVWFIGGNQNWLTDSYLGTRTEAKFHDVLQRGGVLGGTSAGAAIMSRVMIAGGKEHDLHLKSGFGFAPGLIVDQHFRKRNRQARLIDALNQWPGHVGMGIDESTALIIRGGTCEVMGNSDVTITLGDAPGKPARMVPLKAGKAADLMVLSRAAQTRFPRQAVAQQARKGTLVLVGQGEAPEEARQQFLQAAGGKDSAIIVVCADEWSADKDHAICIALKLAGASNVKALPARNRRDVEAPEFLAQLAGAQGIWISNGPIRNLIDTYVDSPVQKALEKLLDRGGVLAGSAAGAELQSAALPASVQSGELEVLSEAYERGFGFLPGMAVTEGDETPAPSASLAEWKARNPHLIGVELNGATALVVRGTKMQVLGKHPITVLDRQPKDPVDYPEYSLVKPGECYDLSARTRSASVAESDTK